MLDAAPFADQLRPGDRSVGHTLRAALGSSASASASSLARVAGVSPPWASSCILSEPADQVVAAETRRLPVEQVARQGCHLRGDGVTLGFDEKGAITGIEMWSWYRWENGTVVEKAPSELPPTE